MLIQISQIQNMAGKIPLHMELGQAFFIIFLLKKAPSCH